MKNASVLRIPDILAEMDRIMQEYPCTMEYETDARSTWPVRWDALRGFLLAEASKRITEPKGGIVP